MKMRRCFAKWEDDFITENYLRMTCKEMADNMGRSLDSVYYRMVHVLKLYVPEEIKYQRQIRTMTDDKDEISSSHRIRSKLEKSKYTLRPPAGYNYLLGYAIHHDGSQRYCYDDITITNLKR